jgi:hypothetical protein
MARRRPAAATSTATGSFAVALLDQLCERLLSLRRDPRRPQHVSIGSRVLDQFDGHIAPKPDLIELVHRP